LQGTPRASSRAASERGAASSAPRRVVSRHRRSSGAGSCAPAEGEGGEGGGSRQVTSVDGDTASQASRGSRSVPRRASDSGSSRQEGPEEGGGSAGNEGTATRKVTTAERTIPRHDNTSPIRQTTRFYTGEATRRLQAARGTTEEQHAGTSTYQYNEDTGLLTTSAGGDAHGDRRQSLYMEQPNRRFTRVATGGRSRRWIPFFRKRQQQPGGVEDDAQPAWGDEDYSGNIVILKKIVDTVQNFAAFVSLLSQGLLGGLGLTNLVMTYFVNPGRNRSSFLRYYSPIAMNLNRYYYAMVCFALVAVINKYARNTIITWTSMGYRQKVFDGTLIILYGAAYVTCVIITPYDDLLTYNYERIPDYYEMRITEAFLARLQVWQILNLIRMCTVLAAWVLASVEYIPMTLLLYWRFQNPHRLVLPPLTRVAPMEQPPGVPLEGCPDSGSVLLPMAATAAGALEGSLGSGHATYTVQQSPMPSIPGVATLPPPGSLSPPRG